MVELTQEQKYVLYHIVKGAKEGKRQTTCGGYAGTGKTSLIEYMTKLLPGFKVCAFTGKAANVLRRKSIEASTIHSLIYVPEIENGQLVGFMLHPELNANGIIVDEASMVSKDLYEDLQSFDLPMIYVGDHGQLEPIGTDFNLMKNPEYRLETIHRNAGDIALFANHLRNGYPANSFRPTTDKVRIVRNWQVGMPEMLQADQIICAYNKSRVDINNKIRMAKGYKDLIQIGERVICLKNNKELGLFNGMQGVIRSLYKKNRKDLMDFEFDGYVFEGISYSKQYFGNPKPDFNGYTRDMPNPFDYAYAITCHKCVHEDTMVETDQGFLPIKKIKPSGMIATPEGPQPYQNLIKNPAMPAVTIFTKNDYNLTVTEDHKVEIWDGEKEIMIEAKELQIGDVVRVCIGSQIPHEDQICPGYLVNNDLAEFLGMMVADGTVWDTGFRLAKRHSEDVERFIELCKTLFEVQAKRIDIDGTPAGEVNSSFLSKWLLSIGGLEPNCKEIPELIFRSSRQIQLSFLKGFFLDGWVSLRNGKFDHVGLYTAYPNLGQKIRALLLRAGIVSHGLSTEPNQNIYIYGSYANRFDQLIGFTAKFKQDRLPTRSVQCKYDNIALSKIESEGLRKTFVNDPLLGLYTYQNMRSRGSLSRRNSMRLCEILGNNELSRILSRRLNYFYTKVTKLEHTHCESMCVEVPRCHRFMQNGFPFSNSQGDEFNNVMVLEQRSGMWDQRRWNYTSASRAKEHLTWILG